MYSVSPLDSGSRLWLPSTVDVARKSILQIAASCWDEERQHAFKTIYAAMRMVDDLVDGRKQQGGPISPEERRLLGAQVTRWMCPDRATELDPAIAELVQLSHRFKLPAWTWQRWTEAMLHDLDHDGFDTFRDYLVYSQGAAVAPGAIFLCLAGATREHGEWHPPRLPICTVARPLAVFAYLVHVLRDFHGDMQTNLHFLARDVVRAHGLDDETLMDVATGKATHPGFAALVRTWCRFACHYQRRARSALDRYQGCLDTCARLSVEIVFQLYSQMLERVMAVPERTHLHDLAIPPDQVLQRVEGVVRRFLPSV